VKQHRQEIAKAQEVKERQEADQKMPQMKQSQTAFFENSPDRAYGTPEWTSKPTSSSISNINPKVSSSSFPTAMNDSTSNANTSVDYDDDFDYDIEFDPDFDFDDEEFDRLFLRPKK
jgi:hypothetical protein